MTLSAATGNGPSGSLVRHGNGGVAGVEACPEQSRQHSNKHVHGHGKGGGQVSAPCFFFFSSSHQDVCSVYGRYGLVENC